MALHLERISEFTEVSERTCEFIAMLDLPDVLILYLTTPTAAAYLMILLLISPCMKCILRSLINQHASIRSDPTPSSPPPPPPRQSMHFSSFGYALVSSRALPWSCRAWLASLPSGYAHVVSRPWPCGSADSCVRGKYYRLVRCHYSHARLMLACA